MPVFNNRQPVHSQVGGQQNVHGSIYHGTVNHIVSCTHEKGPLADSSGSEPLAIDDDDILASLAFPQMFDRRNNVEQPHANTCRWILDLEEYQCWKAQPRSLLWIKGKPGAGKSTLMSFVYHELREERRAGHGIHLDFFFSARGTDMQRTPLGMLRSLLNQLFRQDPSIRSLVRELYTEKCSAFGRSERSWEWQRRELEPLLIQAIMSSAQQRQVIVFIDALDEVGEKSARETAQYFHNINDRISSVSAAAKICISCRHYPIPCTVRGLEVIVEKYNGQDITAFVHDRLDLDCRTLDDTPDLEQWQELGTDLVRGANGIFQWIRLIVPIVQKSIDDGESPEDVRQWLQQVPEELEDVYEHILRNVVDRRHRSQSFQLFQWVCLAERPLSVTEMRYALAAKDTVPRSPRVRCCETRGFVKMDKLMKARVKSLSGGLVEVVRDHDGDDDQERVQVIHQSINDFFLSRGLALLASLQHEVSAVPSASNMAFKQAKVVGQCQANLYWSCLKYLATDVKVNDRHRTPDVMTRKKSKEIIVSHWPFAHYATINLFVHGEKATSYRGEDLFEQTQLLKRIMANWIHIYQVFEWYTGKCPYLNMTTLHAAASANLIDIVEHLVRNNFEVNAQDKEGYTALHHAARWGHQLVVETLFHAGASIDMKTVQEQTPLVLAAGNGHVELVQWLLYQGASLDEAAGVSGNALQAAAKNGNAMIFKILLDAGADVNAQGGHYGNALQAASDGGHEKVVEMLLGKSADVNAQGGYFGNALQAASACGHEKVVEMLLGKGADVNAQGGSYGNALQAASDGGHEKVVEMLLGKGADVNAQGGYFGNALQAASAGGHEKVVEMLLGKGADVNAQGGSYGNALQAASAGGHEKVVEMLLGKGADVNAQGKSYGNALQAASDGGHEKVVEMLLGKGADVNAQGGHYGNALQAASACGHEKMVEMLLGKGADVNAQGGHYGNALQAASACGHEKMVEMLLGKGADVNAQGGSYGNALQAASAGGHEKVVEMLLGKDADVNAQGGSYGNALQAASDGGHEKVVEMLLGKGADVNAQGGEYGNALQVACFHGDEKVVEMLLDKGADVNAQGGEYGNALQAASNGGHEKVVQILHNRGARAPLET